MNNRELDMDERNNMELRIGWNQTALIELFYAYYADDYFLIEI